MSTIDTSLPVPGDEPDDDIAAELEALALRRRRKLPRVTLALAVALVGAGAFIGGAEAQKHLGSTPAASSSGTGAALASRFRGANATTGRQGTFAAGGGGGTFGTVTAIKGSTLYITDASGNVVKVSTSAASQVTKTTAGTVKDIKPGDTVVVRGSQGKNGTIAADSISLGGAGAVTFGGGGSAANGGATGFGGNSNSKGGG
jgi:hypothetical protein